MAKLTIFTPTYNNGNLLKNLYQSLLKQTCQNFEWLIVDDGSNDETKTIVSTFQKNADFKIRYFYQENKGKYKARYNAIQQCKTKLFCCIDADIILNENLVKILLEEWECFQSKTYIIGIGMPIIYRHYNDLSKTIGGSFPKKTPESGKLSELTSKYGYHGETLYMFATNILKKLTIPKTPKAEKFWKDSAFYFPLNKEYKVHWLNIPAGESVYQPGGLSDNRLNNEINSPNLTLLSYKKGAIYHPLFLHKIANCCMYITWKKLLKMKDRFGGRIPLPVYLPAYLMEPVYCSKFRKNIKSCLKNKT